MKRTTIKAILAVCISILATGAAGAADCPLVATSAAPEGALKRPDLVGDSFRVRRAAFVHATPEQNTISHETIDVGVYEITNEREVFTILRTVVGGNLFDYTGSYDPSELQPYQTPYGRVDARAVYSPAGQPSGIIFRGPLAHMILTPSCR